MKRWTTTAVFVDQAPFILHHCEMEELQEWVERLPNWDTLINITTVYNKGWML